MSTFETAGVRALSPGGGGGAVRSAARLEREAAAWLEQGLAWNWLQGPSHLVASEVSENNSPESMSEKSLIPN